MKLLRILLSIAGLLLLVCVLAIAALLMFADPNKLKPVIAEEIKQQTGYQLAIDGNLSWSIYPHVGIKVERMALRAPDQPQAFIDLQGVNIAVRLGALLRGERKLTGDVYIRDVRLMNVHAVQARVGMRWQNNILTLAPINALLYDGTLFGTAHGINLSGVPRWDWDIAMDGVQVKPLLADVNGPDAKLSLSGIGSIHLKANTQGKNRDELLEQLNGQGEFSLKNGVINGIDINYFVQSADALLNKKSLTAPENLNQTSFDSLTGSFTVKEGDAKTEDMLLTSSAFLMRGQGNLNLLPQTIDLQLQIKSQNTLKTQWEIPVLVTGALGKPDVQLDMASINQMLTQKEFEKVKEKVREKAKEITGKAGEFLQNLLGQ